MLGEDLDGEMVEREGVERGLEWWGEWRDCFWAGMGLGLEL